LPLCPNQKLFLRGLSIALPKKVLNLYKITEREREMARKKAPTRRDTLIGEGQ
jgi:hypothetical protein